MPSPSRPSLRHIVALDAPASFVRACGASRPGGAGEARGERLRRDAERDGTAAAPAGPMPKKP